MEESERRALGIDILVGNRHKFKIPELLKEWFEKNVSKETTELDSDILSARSWDRLELDRPRMHTRAFLKIQDGCGHFCSYCIVPFVRGNPVCRDARDVVKEAGRIAASGCGEIVLTGIHIGMYEGLGELVREIDAVKGVQRIRFGSIEPFAVGEKLLDLLSEAKSFCPHLHLPLQSGDDGVLLQMRRGYTAAGFAKTAELARKKLGEDLHISTDLMVGFPGEDDKAFENSLRFVEELRFGKVHVFPYSPRKGTLAAELERPPREAVRERVKRALDLASRLHEKYASRWLGNEVNVLVEESRGGAVKGLSRHFVRVLAQSRDGRSGEEIAVKPEKYLQEALIAGAADENAFEGGELSDFH